MWIKSRSPQPGDTSDSPTRIPLVVGYHPATRLISSIFHKHTFSHPPNFVLLLKYIPLVGPLFSARERERALQGAILTGSSLNYLKGTPRPALSALHLNPITKWLQ